MKYKSSAYSALFAFVFVLSFVVAPEVMHASVVDYSINSEGMLSYNFSDPTMRSECTPYAAYTDYIALFDASEWDTGEYWATGGLIQLSCATDEVDMGYDLRIELQPDTQYQLVHIHDDTLELAIPGGFVLGNPYLEPYLVEIIPISYSL